MRSSFTKSVNLIITLEGGYCCDPKDPGGETKYGISRHEYPVLNIKSLTPEAAIAIYLKDYWIPAGCDVLPWPLDLVVFDTTVNLGLHRAKEFLAITHDWNNYLTLRSALYDRIVKKKPASMKFLHGWKNRVEAVRQFISKALTTEKKVLS